MYKPPTKEEFEAMSPEDQRVAIAEDVLALLDEEKIIAERGNYIQNKNATPADYLDEDESSDVLPIAAVRLMESEPCYVCAVGAYNLARARISMLGHDPIHLPHHDIPFMSTMEENFEGGSGSEFAKQYANDSDRLRAIMENIVRNNGTFVADDLGGTICPTCNQLCATTSVARSGGEFDEEVYDNFSACCGALVEEN